MPILPSVIAAFALLVLAGCASTGPSTFVPSEAADAASVRGQWTRESAFVWEGYSLLAVDDKFISHGMGRAENTAVKVPAGLRKLAVKVSFNRGLNSGGPYEGFVPIVAELRPATAYRVKGKVTGTAVEAWLEEETSEQRVSELAAVPFRKQAQSTPIPIFIPSR